LADILVPDLAGVLEFEGFAYVAWQVWGEKTGRPSNQMPNAANMIYPGQEPSGTEFDEDPAYFVKRIRNFGSDSGLNPKSERQWQICFTIRHDNAVS